MVLEYLTGILESIRKYKVLQLTCHCFSAEGCLLTAAGFKGNVVMSLSQINRAIIFFIFPTISISSWTLGGVKASSFIVVLSWQ
jgi:hypothetical protein